MRIGFLITILLAGCGGTTMAHREPDEYTGCGTDEHWRIFDDNEPTAIVDDTRGPTITQPDVTTTIAYSPKAIFQWNQDSNDPGASDGDVPYMDGIGGCNACCPTFSTGALTSLHLPSISGDIYDLQFYIDGNDIHRVVTTLQEWTAPDELWLSWKGKSVSLKIYRATVLVNQLKAGPFVTTQPTVLRIGS